MRASLIAILLIGLLAGTSIAIDAVPASASLAANKDWFGKPSVLQTSVRPGRGYFGDNRKRNNRKKSKSCTPNLPRISCHGREGIFIQTNGGSINKVNNPNNLAPTPIPDGDTVNFAVCNLDNLEFSNGGIANLVPSLISSVGANADVRILIEHSANVRVSDEFNFGVPGLVEQALIATPILGPIGPNANIEIDIHGSANVHLSKDEATATLTNANLLDILIDGNTNQPAGQCLTGCMKVNVKDSANIVGKARRNDVIVQDSSELEENTIIAQCFENAHIAITKRHVATISGARDVTIDASRLSEDTVQSLLNTDFTKIDIHLDNFATVYAKDDTIVTNVGFLVDSVVDLNAAGTILGSTIHVDGHNIGTVSTDDLTVSVSSALVSDFIKGGTTNTGTVFDVHVDRLGDVHASGNMVIDNSDLVQDLIELGTVQDTMVILGGTTIGSVSADELTLNGAGTALVESLLNFNNALSDFEYDIHLFDIANTMVYDLVTLNQQTALILQLVLSRGANVLAVDGAEDLLLRVKNAGNVLCPRGRRGHAQLAIASNVDPTISAFLIADIIRAVSGTWTTQEFAIVLHFLANVQVVNNQDDDFDFFNVTPDGPLSNVFDSPTSDAEAMLQLTESKTGEFTRCIRPPKNPKARKNGRKNDKRGGNKKRGKKRGKKKSGNKNRRRKNGRK